MARFNSGQRVENHFVDITDATGGGRDQAIEHELRLLLRGERAGHVYGGSGLTCRPVRHSPKGHGDKRLREGGGATSFTAPREYSSSPT